MRKPLLVPPYCTACLSSEVDVGPPLLQPMIKLALLIARIVGSEHHLLFACRFFPFVDLKTAYGAKHSPDMSPWLLDPPTLALAVASQPEARKANVIPEQKMY